MPVDTPHPDYVRWAPHFEKMRAVVLGQEAMEVATIGSQLPIGSLGVGGLLGRDYYLPKLSGQDDESYRAYVRRASFYGATARTVDALVGSVFRRDPVVQASDEMLEQLENVDLAGTALPVFAQDVLREELKVGNNSILLDMPPEGGDRPYWTNYRVEDVLACELERIGGSQVLTAATLRECDYVRTEGGEYRKVTKLRLLDLDDSGLYRMRVLVRGENETGWIEEAEFLPRRRGERLPFIPFFPSWPLVRPPLLDLADVNLAHYRKAADYAHGLHFTALPTPWIADVDTPKGPFKIGSETAWTMSEQGSCGMLEFTGAGMSAIKDAMIDDETRMAHLGAELLMPDKRMAEAAAALRIRSGAKTGSLAALSNRISWRLTKAAQTHAWWIGESDQAVAEIAVTLNTEFAESYLEPQELTAWVAARQAGEVTRKMFLDFMAKKEALGETTVDEAIVELEAENDVAAERDELRKEAATFRDMTKLAGMRSGDDEEGEGEVAA